MYTPKSEYSQPEGPRQSAQIDVRKGRSSAKYSGAGFSENRKSAKVQNNSRTPT